VPANFIRIDESVEEMKEAAVELRIESPLTNRMLDWPGRHSGFGTGEGTQGGGRTSQGGGRSSCKKWVSFREGDKSEINAGDFLDICRQRGIVARIWESCPSPRSSFGKILRLS